MEAQLQIRQNAQEVQEYMKDLFDWEKSVKKRASEKKSGTAASSAPGAVAGVRARAAPAPTREAPTSLQLPALPVASRASGRGSDAGGGNTTGAAPRPVPHPASHVYTSYDKWSRFDVDAALADSSDDDTGRGKARPGRTGPTAGPAAAQAAAAAAVASRSSNAVLAACTPGGAKTTVPEQQYKAKGDRQQQQEQQQQQQQQQQPPQQQDAAEQDAVAWKDRGNTFLQGGKLMEALEAYTRSIELQPSCLAYANRGLVHLKLGAAQSAEDDCCAAIALDTSYAKARLRRGAARKAQGSWLGAAEDYEAALRLEPRNAEARGERDKCMQLYWAGARLRPPSKRHRLAVHAAPAAAPVAMDGGGGGDDGAAPAQVALPVAGDPEAGGPAAGAPAVDAASAARAAGRPAVGFATDDPGVAGPVIDDSLPAAVLACGTLPAPAPQQHGSGSLTASSSSTMPATAAGGSAGSDAVCEVVATPAAPASSSVTPGAGAAGTGAPLAAMPAGSAAAAATPTTSAASRGAPATPPAASPPPAPQRAAANTRAGDAAAAAATQLAARRAAALTRPRTSSEFEAVWRGLSTVPDLQAQYLRTIEPHLLPQLLKTFLTAPLLVALVRAALAPLLAAAAADGARPRAGGDGGRPPDGAGSGGGCADGSPDGGASVDGSSGRRDVARVLQVLQQLVRVPRFGVTAMCLGSKDKAALRQLWQAASDALLPGERAELDALKEAYRL